MISRADQCNWSSHMFVKICRGIMTNLHTHRSETNGIAERVRVKEETSTLSVQDQLNHGGEKRWNVFFFETFEIYEPVGKLSTKEDTTRYFVGQQHRLELHQFSSKHLKGMLGYALNAGICDKRSTRGRCRRVEQQHCFRSPRQKIQGK